VGKIPKDAELNSTFHSVLEQSLNRRGLRLGEVCRAKDVMARRVLEEYGAMFVASDSVLVPPRCVFTSEEEVQAFQRAATFRAEAFGEFTIELQPAAMDALLEAREEVRSLGLDITPRDGSEAGRRSYSDTLRLWNTRFLPALEHWAAQGRLSPEEAERLRSLAPHEQVAEVLELEREGIFFSKDFSKTILQSVAAPGTSPHLSMYAFDAVEFKDERVRRVLARHGWFQTVASDLPHFTFLGLEETELPAHGLRTVEACGQLFWIPDIEEVRGQRSEVT
jgi:hypothetical protein